MTRLKVMDVVSSRLSSNRLFLVMFWAIVTSCIASSPSTAGSTVTCATESTLISDLKALEDPTILSRRIWLDTEWSKYRDGSSNLDETLGVLWAWRITSHQDWALRLKLPYKWHLSGDNPGDYDRDGTGDLKLATGTAWRLNETWRAGGGVEVRLPTGKDELSENVWKVQEFGALAWDAAHWLTLSPSFEYNHSIKEEHGAAPQHYLEIYFPATFLLPDKWSVTTRYEAKVNYEDDNTWTHSAKVTLAKQLGGPPVGFGLSIKKPFNSGPKDFQVNFVMTYYFRLQSGDAARTK